MIIVLVTGTCDFVIGDWCWCFGIANFGSPMIAWWRLSNLSSFVLALEHSQTQHPIHDVFFSKNISHFYAKIFHIFMQKYFTFLCKNSSHLLQECFTFLSKNISVFYAKIVHICFKNISHFSPKVIQISFKSIFRFSPKTNIMLSPKILEKKWNIFEANVNHFWRKMRIIFGEKFEIFLEKFSTEQ